MDIHVLYDSAQSIASWITGIRRDLHRIPETGFAEFKTQAYICSVLDSLSIPYTTERTWVIGEIVGAFPGPVIGLRADIDALPVTEPETCSFRSEHEGWMHACGHDAHTAMVLGAARLLVSMRDSIHGSVRLFFQPAEETDGGAEPMVQAGAMNGVSAVYGLHVQPYLNVGQIDTRPGTLNASTDEVEITIHGVSGHAARPNLGVDAIVCAGQMITALQTIVSRNTSPLKPAVLSFGVVRGGTAKNIICDEVILQGTLRTADPELRAALKQRIREVCQGIAAAMGATVDVNIITGYAPLVNDAKEANRILRLGRELLGEENVSMREEPSMGGEDFSYFSEAATGAFYHLGCATQQPAAALHHRDFTVDERCLPIGAALHCAIILDRMNEEA